VIEFRILFICIIGILFVGEIMVYFEFFVLLDMVYSSFILTEFNSHNPRKVDQTVLLLQGNSICQIIGRT